MRTARSSEPFLLSGACAEPCESTSALRRRGMCAPHACTGRAAWVAAWASQVVAGGTDRAVGVPASDAVVGGGRMRSKQEPALALGCPADAGLLAGGGRRPLDPLDADRHGRSGWGRWLVATGGMGVSVAWLWGHRGACARKGGPP